MKTHPILSLAFLAVVGCKTIHRDLTDLRSAAGFQEPYRRAFDDLVDSVAAFLARRQDVRFPDTRAAAFVLVHGIEGIATAFIERRRDAALDIGAIARASVDMIAAYASTGIDAGAPAFDPA